MSSTASPINKESLAYYLTYQFVPKPYLLKRTGRAQIPCYQFPKIYNPKTTLRQSESQIAKNLYAHLNNIIKSSLDQSSQPIGLLLSGGIDSSILLYLLRKNTSKKIYTVSGAYASDKSHLKLCASLAKKYNTIHQELIITPPDLLQLSNLYAAGVENPIGDNGLLATHLMLKALSSSTNTIYTGDGADCLFHGLKAHYLDFLDKNRLHHLNPHSNPSTMITQKLLSPKTNYPGYEHYKYDEIFLTKNEAHQYLGFDAELTRPLKAVTKKIKTNDPIKRTILLDLNFLVVNRVDYILKAAANNATIILPFLDPALVDYSLRIPSKYFIKDSQQKYILKKAFNNVLPKEVISQKKRGMSPPFLEWYVKNRSFVLKTLHKAQALGVAPEYTRYLIKNLNRSNEYAIGMRIWLILNLVLWSNGQQE